MKKTIRTIPEYIKKIDISFNEASNKPHFVFSLGPEYE
jgi:hypothetical protein